MTPLEELLAGKRRWHIEQGDSAEVLRTFPDGIAQCCVTSPPYFGLRDYGTSEWEGGDPDCNHLQPAPGPTANKGNNGCNGTPYKEVCGKCGARRGDRQLGLEKVHDCGAWMRRPVIALFPAVPPLDEEGQPDTTGLLFGRGDDWYMPLFGEMTLCGECFVCRMVAIFREVRRVLRDDGVLWLNLGDCYAKADCGCDLKPKDLCGVPWRVAMALQADGWWLRSDVVWAKGWSFCAERAGNPMPESIKDRPTRAHEFFFLLAKSERYWYDSIAVREQAAPETVVRLSQETLDTQQGGFKVEQYEADFPGRKRRDRRPADILRHLRDTDAGKTRNLRDVWAINTQGFPGAHFATFPENLIEPCILAGSSDRACAKCGKPWERIARRLHKTSTEQMAVAGKGSGKFARTPPTDRPHTLHSRGGHHGDLAPEIETLGFSVSCGCEADTLGSIVLDPFAGSGTVGAVCARTGRRFLGVELNPDYLAMATDRIARIERASQPSLFDEPQDLEGVTDLDDFRPHAVIDCGESVHVVPCALLEDVAAGVRPLDALPNDVWQVIVGDWLADRTPE